MDDLTLMFIAGVVILTMSLFLHLRKRTQLEARRKAERQAAAKTAREEAQKLQTKMGEQVKKQHITLNSDRIPLPNAVGQTFTGSYTPQSIAKWEVEIHQIGRQIMGQIDSKMVALQTLTLEANRSANRVELLIEQLERLILERQELNSIITKTPDKVSEQADVVSKSEVSAEFSEQLPIDSQSSMLETELLDVKSFPTNELSVSPIEISSDELSRKSQNIQSSTDSVPAEALVAVEAAFEDEIEISMEEEPQTVPFVAASKVEHVADSGVRNADGNVVSQTTITDEMPTLESFADVLDDLELELGELKEQIDETANVVNSLPPATILKAEQLRTEQLGNDLSEKRPETFESIQKPRQASTIPFQRNPTRRTIDQDSIALEQIASNTVTAAGGIPGKIELASGLDFASPTLSRPNPYAAKSANERSLFSVHSGNPPTDQQGTQQSRSLGSQPRAGRTVGVPTPTPPKAKMPTRNALSIDSLYDNADASLVLSGRPEKKNRNTPSPPGIPVTGPRLSLRKQVELLANAGFTVNQIAQKLGLSIGEIDLMLNLRR